MGDAFHNAGLIASPVITLLLGVICVYSQHMLVSTLLGRINYCWSSPAQTFLASGLLETFDKVFCSLLDMYVFEKCGLLFDEWRDRSFSGGAMFVAPQFQHESQRPGPYGHCAPFLTALFQVTFRPVVFKIVCSLTPIYNLS
jgi:hypothetical protein